MAKRVFPKTFKLEVTQKDIDEGIVGKATKCALARGARRCLKTNKKVVVSALGTIFVGEAEYISRARKNSPEKFIAKFDGGKKVKPTTFTFRKVK